ncbi:MAG: cyanophycin synthetase [Candidatus Absconditabacteria bacterium]
MKIMLIGAGGSGISSIGLILKDLGFDNIVGIDIAESEISKKLEKKGIRFVYGHGIELPEKEDFVIYSDAAINSPEVQKSLEYETLGEKYYHKPYSYFDFIGEISKYFVTIAIAGTHGKSTSTAIAISSLSKISQDFGLGIVGALVPEFNNKNYLINENYNNDIRIIFEHIISGSYKGFNKEVIKKYMFVIEADEFNRHFLKLDVDYATIHNIELDHSDCFQNIDIYYDVFKTFAQRVRYKIFGLSGEPLVKKLSEEIPGKFKLLDVEIFEFIHLIGKHNQNNATLIFNMFKNICSKVKSGQIKNSIIKFKGLWRRTETIKTSKSGAFIISDYGHHPTEIKTVIMALKEKYPNKKIICIFQPHQARRVIEFWDKFIETIKLADTKIIYNIYTARENIEKLLNGIENEELKSQKSIEMIGNKFAEKVGGKYITDFELIKKIITDLGKDEILIYFSAGNLDYDIRMRDGLKFL